MAATEVSERPRSKSLTPAPDQPAETKRLDALRDQAMEEADSAKAIIDKAIADGRTGLSDDESKKVEEHLAKAEKLHAAREQAKSGAAAYRAAKEFTDAIFAGSNTTGASPYRAEADGGKAWCDRLTKSMSDQFGRYKGLVAPTGAVLVNVPAPPAVQFGQPVMNLRSVIPAEATNGVFAYLKQTLRQNNASPVAIGTLKPTSNYEFTRVQDEAVTIAHLSTPVPRQWLADSAALADVIRSEMAFGLELALADEILNGDGTGDHFLGLANTSGVLTVPGLAPAPMDQILNLRKAMTALELNGLQASAIVMNPTDWESIETAQTTDAGFVLNGASQTVPIDSAARRLYGVPVIASVACPVGTAWVADFLGSSKLFVREEGVLSWSEGVYDPTTESTGFSTNTVVFRFEGRFGFGATRPSGIVKVNLAAA